MQDTPFLEATRRLLWNAGRALFVLSVLLSLIPLFAVERTAASEGHWYLAYKLTFPWLVLVICGIMIWQLSRRRKIEHQIAGILLSLIGMANGTIYELLAKFAAAQ